jgi:hypothetical protein
MMILLCVVAYVVVVVFTWSLCRVAANADRMAERCGETDALYARPFELLGTPWINEEDE